MVGQLLLGHIMDVVVAVVVMVVMMLHLDLLVYASLLGHAAYCTINFTLYRLCWLGGRRWKETFDRRVRCWFVTENCRIGGRSIGS